MFLLKIFQHVLLHVKHRHTLLEDSPLHYAFPSRLLFTFTTKCLTLTLTQTLTQPLKPSLTPQAAPGSSAQKRGLAKMSLVSKKYPPSLKLNTHKHTHFPTRSTCAPLYWPSLLLFLNGILKAMFTAKLCALWTVQELQQILKYWLLSLLVERASSSRRERDGERDGVMGG